MVCDYEYNEETQTMRINCLGCIYGASIEDSEVCMARTIDKLMEVRKPVRIVFAEARQYEYGFNEARLLLEIGKAFEKIVKIDKILLMKNVSVPGCEKCVPARYSLLRELIGQIKYDPVDAYKKLIREIRHTKVRGDRSSGLCKECYSHYVENALIPMQKIFENCELIQMAKEKLTEHKNRSFYREVFHPTIRPNFMYTRYMSIPPPNAELIHRYSIGATEVGIYSIPGEIRKLYHIIPPEFRLNEEEYMLLDRARTMLGRHEPKESELAEPQRMRENMLNIGLDMLRDIAESHNIVITDQRMREMADILSRYTVGLGVLELMLKDEKVQDILINSPVGVLPVYLFHADFQECKTNIVPSIDDAESWATRFRLLSGRPLDEANPVLDAELSVPGGRARVAAITRTLSPDGLGFAFRRHRDMPWTYPLFINNGMIDAFSAGLMWFLVDGGRAIIIGGTRSSGKTSFLNATMLQIMPKLRTVTLEDTLELSVEYMRTLGYNIERMKSRSVITNVETELPADEALRAALRLGDSCLIVGEVRSREAKALFEAMRIGALANVVAGTIHGASAYGVFDRLVNDLGVPATSFKAADLIVICNVIKSPDGLHSFRRITEMTEIRKHWREDPLEEGGFMNLLEYSSIADQLKPTKTLLTGESEVINEIASSVREWKGRWDDVWNNINLRAKILQAMADAGKTNAVVMEAPFLTRANTMFHIISEEVMRESGSVDSSAVFSRWQDWFRKSAKSQE
ncbi:MAG: type II/IV secretion system ATPase subunit [Candidatus Aenigmarchaeota archaeon]|nr:type II/IV secretion system ATPase subunit [Candidatus Aenigmarchaeota archaeon]